MNHKGKTRNQIPSSNTQPETNLFNQKNTTFDSIQIKIKDALNSFNKERLKQFSVISNMRTQIRKSSSSTKPIETEEQDKNSKEILIQNENKVGKDCDKKDIRRRLIKILGNNKTYENRGVNELLRNVEDYVQVILKEKEILKEKYLELSNKQSQYNTQEFRATDINNYKKYVDEKKFINTPKTKYSCFCVTPIPVYR